MGNIDYILKENFKGKLVENYPMSRYTSFRCGGNARYIIYPESIEELKKIIEISKEYNLKFLVLGKGTNVLISENGFDGIIISTLKLNKIRFDGKNLECESGVKISSLLRFCIENSLKGIEFLAGIPGTVGGAVKNNAGLKNEWISEKIDYVKFIDFNSGEIVKKEKKDIFFDYRRSEFDNSKIIVDVNFKLENGTKEEIIDKIAIYMKERKNKQPVGYSAGSIFKNPHPYYAGKLIEKSGLKGYSIGDCYISEKHANFIINRGNGKAYEVYKLIKIIKEKVKEKFDITLELEIQLIGEFE
jgi:UDP-N-acetylmuramate dehydrogenase